METVIAPPEPPADAATLPKGKGNRGCRSKALAGCGVIVIFALGTLFGVLLAVLLVTWVVPRVDGWRTPESQQFITKYMADQLQLTPEQRDQVDPIVVEMLEKRFELRKVYLLETREMLTADIFPQIREHLTPEQIERGDQMLRKWEEDNRWKLQVDQEEIDREKRRGND